MEAEDCGAELGKGRDAKDADRPPEVVDMTFSDIVLDVASKVW